MFGDNIAIDSGYCSESLGHVGNIENKFIGCYDTLDLEFYDVMDDNVAADCGYCSDNCELVGNMDCLAGIHHYV